MPGYGERGVRRERRRICVLTRRTIREARKISGSRALKILPSEMLRNVVNFRNKYIAHATGLTRLKRDGGNGPLPLPKLGDETDLLAQTLTIIGRLSLCIEGIDFRWGESEKIAKRNAEALWHGVTIKVLR
jgi:hypothetical protein